MLAGAVWVGSGISMPARFTPNIFFDPNRLVFTIIELIHIITTKMYLGWFLVQKKESSCYYHSIHV